MGTGNGIPQDGEPEAVGQAPVTPSETGPSALEILQRAASSPSTVSPEGEDDGDNRWELLGEGEDTEDPDTSDTPSPTEPEAEAEEPSGVPPTREPTDAEIDKLLQRYGNDPRAIAKAKISADALIARQGNELGTYRGQQQTPIGPGSEPEPQQPAVQQTEIRLFDPDTDPWDADTGWPVDEYGNRFQPTDQFGEPIIPETVFEVEGEKLSALYPNNPAYAAAQLTRMRQAAEADYHQRLGVRAQAYQQESVQLAMPEVEKAAGRFGKQYPEAVARQLAQTYLDLAVKVVQNTPGAQLNREAVEAAYKVVVYHAIMEGVVESDAAELMAQSPQTNNGARIVPLRTNVGFVVPNGTGGGNGSGKLPAGIASQRQWIRDMSDADLAKYGGEKFKFDEDE